MNTQVDFPFNTFRSVLNGRPHPDQSVTTALMQACAGSAAHAGPRCVLGNHDLIQSVLSGYAASIYQEVDTLWSDDPGGFAVYFQTVSANTANCQSIAIAVSHHATSVELWPTTAHYHGFSSVSASTLEQWNSDLVNGYAPTCS